uniref:Uncharacterized protein n=1 Tax=Anopheles funestus TaxID=62324 RepID=A0A182RDD6_ANOFN
MKQAASLRLAGVRNSSSVKRRLLSIEKTGIPPLDMSIYRLKGILFIT